MMVKKKIISWKKSTFRAFPPGESGRRALRARLPDSHRVERRRVSFASRALARCFFAVSKPQKPGFAVWPGYKLGTQN